MTAHLDQRASLLLSVQRALLGAVSTALRAVVIEYDQRSASIHAYYDGPINDDDAESMSCVEAEVIADFPADYAIEVIPVRHDAPQPLPATGIWAYQRRE